MSVLGGDVYIMAAAALVNCDPYIHAQVWVIYGCGL